MAHRFNKLRLAVASLVLMVLTLSGCGGGSVATDSQPSAPVQDVKVTSSYQAGVRSLDSGAGVVEVEAEVFTAPKSLGLVVGSVFVFDKVAYKVTAVTTEGTERDRLFTTAPTLDETFSQLSIVGTVPLSGGTFESASSVQGVLKSRSGKFTAKTAGMKKQAGEDSPECSVPEDAPWQTDLVVDNNTAWSGTSGGVLCKVNDAVTVSGKLGIQGLIAIDFLKDRPASQNKFDITVRIAPSVVFEFEKEYGKDWRKNVATFRIPVAVSGGIVQIAVPIDFIAGARASVKGSAAVSAVGQVEAHFTGEPKAWATVYGSANVDGLQGSIDLAGYVGMSPGLGVSVLSIDIASFQVDGKIIAEINGQADLEKACAGFFLKTGAGLSVKKFWGDVVSLGEAAPTLLWPKDDTPQCLSYPKLVVQANGNPLTGEGSTSVPYTPYGGVFGSSAKIAVKNVSAASAVVAEDETVSTSANLSVAGSLLYGATIASVQWQVTGGDMPLTFSNVNGATTALGAASSVGTTAQVKVSLTSSSGQIATETFRVVRNKLPLALGRIVESGTLLSLDASASYDPNGQSIRSYRWILPDGSVINTKSPVVSVSSLGLPRPLEVKLIVWSSGSLRERSEITPVAQVTGSDAIAIIEQGFYGADEILTDCSSSSCTPRYWKVQGEAGKITTDSDYVLREGRWVVDSSGVAENWILNSTGWQPESGCAVGQVSAYSVGSTGAATISFCNGNTDGVTARAIDASGKTLKVLGLNPPAAFESTVMPSGSMLYWWDWQTQRDHYYLYTGSKVSNWVVDPVTMTPAEVPFSSLDDFISANSTPAAPAVAYTGWSGLCFSFDTGGTLTGGALTLWSCDTTGMGASRRIGASTYERRVVYGVELLIIREQAPQNGAGRLIMYAVKDGYLYGGAYEAAGNTATNQPGFNKIMLNAILQAGGKPAAVD